MTRWQSLQKRTGYNDTTWFSDKKQQLVEQQRQRFGTKAISLLTTWVRDAHEGAAQRYVREAVGLCLSR